MFMVVKKVEFEAAHFLRDHVGLCKNLHGHTYKLEVGLAKRNKVTAEFEESMKNGYALSNNMFIDFSSIKELIKDSILDKLDHQNLNEVFNSSHPTCEFLIMEIRELIKNELFVTYESCIALVYLKLYETSTSYAEWRI